MASGEAFFADELERFADADALLLADGRTLSYLQLARLADEFARGLGSERKLLLIEARNQLPTLVAYLGALRARHPVLLATPDKPEALARLIEVYRPGHVYRELDGAWALSAHPSDVPLHEELALLLGTSGSTGSSRFVRLSRRNVDSNARSIASYLELTAADRALTSLPFFYSYGHSVVSSHLAVGASLILTERSVIDEEFWQLARDRGATSFAAVPYTIELLERVGFADLELPNLRYLTQAGGRLSPELAARYAELSRRRGFRFFVMYGQTEATARISYVPPEDLPTHPGSIGRAIPGGHLELRDDEGRVLEGPGARGELIYRGPNVMMGYASSADALATGPELTELATGDIAERDAEGYFTIVGRKSRFLKLFGLRVNLADVEAQLAPLGEAVAATGDDDGLVVALVGGDAAAVRRLVREKFGLPDHAFRLLTPSELPRLPSGKLDYERLRAAARAATPDAASSASADVTSIFRALLHVSDPRPTDTFRSLGGDSLAFIQMHVQLERHWGWAPPRWEEMTIAELNRLTRRAPARLQSLEPAVILRACAITAIVLNHLYAPLGQLPFPLDGGAYFLMMAAGFSLARFQLEQVRAGAPPSTVLRGLPRILVPTWLLLFALELYRADLQLDVLTFTSNVFSPTELNRYWFIETFLQLHLLTFLVLCWPRARETLRVAPLRAGWIALGVAALALFTLGSWWQGGVLFREPPRAAWMLILGLLIHESTSRWARLALSVAAFGLAFAAFSGHPSMVAWLGGGAAALAWLPRIHLWWPLTRLLATVASASLYVYILHVPLLLWGKGHGVAPSLLFVGSMMLGVAGWAVSERVWGGWYSWRSIRSVRSIHSDAAEAVDTAAATPASRET